MSDFCCWPRCKAEHELVMVVNGRHMGFCDRHWEMIMSEDDAQMRRARKKVGIPMPKRISLSKPEPEKEPEEPTGTPQNVEAPVEGTSDFQKSLVNGDFGWD